MIKFYKIIEIICNIIIMLVMCVLLISKEYTGAIFCLLLLMWNTYNTVTINVTVYKIEEK
jgi:hypothetical protein